MCEKCGCSDTADDGHGQAGAHDSAVAAALSRNDRLAERNRGYFLAKRVCVVNLVSCPRARVHALVERTVAEYGKRRRVAVVTLADLEKWDAFHGHHDHAHHSDSEPHHDHHDHALADEPRAVDAHALGHVLSRLDLDHLDLVLIENGGSAACQAVYDVGETARVAVFSAREGDLRPLKMPLLFSSARAVVISEMEQAGACGFDEAKARAHLAQVAARAAVLPLSAETGGGLDAWYAFLDVLVSVNGK